MAGASEEEIAKHIDKLSLQRLSDSFDQSEDLRDALMMSKEYRVSVSEINEMDWLDFEFMKLEASMLSTDTQLDMLREVEKTKDTRRQKQQDFHEQQEGKHTVKLEDMVKNFVAPATKQN